MKGLPSTRTQRGLPLLVESALLVKRSNGFLRRVGLHVDVVFRRPFRHDRIHQRLRQRGGQDVYGRLRRSWRGRDQPFHSDEIELRLAQRGRIGKARDARFGLEAREWPKLTAAPKPERRGERRN